MSDSIGGIPTGSVPPQGQENIKPPTEVAKDVAIIFLVGVAIVLGLLLATYLAMVFLDKYCCCIPGWRAAGEMVEIDRGPVARKAGLWGLRHSERKAILERILVGKPYTPDMIQSEKGDEENPVINENITDETTETQDDVNPVEMADEEAASLGSNHIDVHEREINEGETREEEKDEIVRDFDEATHDITCAICLCEYEDGEVVLSGTSCNHLFHKSCAFEWLSKHDHCPYCRKEMMTADEMRETAQELLGEERVLEMRMWGPTQELMRNSFEDNEEGSNANASSTTVELTRSQSRTNAAVGVHSA